MSERLIDTNTNPWYVLATVFEEQPEGVDLGNYDKELATKNRRAWNGWFCGGLSDEKRKGLAEKTGLDIDELKPLSSAELQEITKLFQSRLGSDAELPNKAEEIDFQRVNFSRYFCAGQFIFVQPTKFNSAMFVGDANFISASFVDVAHFYSALFCGDAEFGSASFGYFANFGSASFDAKARFNSASFGYFANFGSVRFSEYTDFNSVTFGGLVTFASSEFKYTTRFHQARFLTAVPKFHAATLYDDTTFTLPDDYRDNWPPLEGPRNLMSVEDQKRAYNRLRLFMNRALLIDEEQFFHRMEMRCKAVGAKWYHKPFYGLYSCLSDFGNSVWRPLAWLGGLIILGAVVLTFYFDMVGHVSEGSSFWEAMGWSVANTLPFFGYDKLHSGMDYAEKLPAQMKIITGVQTLSGYTLLFLLGLGLRNRFRLR